MEEALISLLRDDASVSSHLGARIHWVRRPQGESAYPTCVLAVASSNTGIHSKGSDGLSQSRVQVDVYGRRYGDAKLAIRAIHTLMHGYRGTVGGVSFKRCSMETERDLTDRENNDDVRLFRVTADILIWHTQ
ncbi:MAG: DUF3168 domain-containing protein [Pseudomonadota bacterium]